MAESFELGDEASRLSLRVAFAEVVAAEVAVQLRLVRFCTTRRSGCYTSTLPCKSVSILDSMPAPQQLSAS
jgi:hypothetical protein